MMDRQPLRASEMLHQMYEKQTETPHIESGEFVDAYNTADSIFTKYATFMKTEIVDDQECLVTDVYEGRVNYDGGPVRPSGLKNSRAYQCSIMQRKKDGAFGPETEHLLLIQTLNDTEEPAKDYILSLHADGNIFNLAANKRDFSSKFPGEEDFGSNYEKELVDSSLATISRQLDGQKSEQQRVRRKKIVGYRKLIGVTTAFAIASSGVYAFALDPYLEDKEARASYDTEDNVLSGDSIEVSNPVVATMPAATFNQIPSYKDDDSLLNTRAVDIVGNDCEVVGVDVRKGDTVVAAISDKSDLVGSQIILTADNINNVVEVCLSGVESEKNWLGYPDSKIALQIQR